MRVTTALALTLCVSLFTPVWGDAPVTVETQQLSAGLVMLKGRGGNVVVSFGADGTFVVDDQYVSQYQPIIDAIKVLTDRPVRFVINTHWHSDHTGSNEQMSGIGATIVAHDNVRTRVSTDQIIEFFKAERPALKPAGWPVVTFSDEVRFHVNGESIHVFHVVDAHTDGDAMVHFRNANVIHTGDVFFNGFYPFIDTSSGGSVAGMLAAVDRALALADDDTKIVPGHGELAGRKQLVEYRAMLAATHNAVATAMISGKDLDGVIAARPTAAFDAAWGGGSLKPETYVRLLFDEITRSTLKH